MWGVRGRGWAVAVAMAVALPVAGQEAVITPAAVDRASLGPAAATLRPMVPGVRMLGEAEVAGFLAAPGDGLLLDARLPEAVRGGTIPGAVVVPAVTLAAENPAQGAILAALGGPGAGTGAAPVPLLVVFDDGIAGGGEAEAALQALVAAGWPAARLGHYRGGMRDWQALGLALAMPGGG